MAVPYVLCKRACDPGKICNFYTGRCVKIDGGVAKKAMTHPLFIEQVRRRIIRNQEASRAAAAEANQRARDEA
eukprot:684117-Prorocentrum_minimum.AAC.6